jgi:protein TonB
MLPALAVAVAAHLLLLLGVGFELPEPPSAPVRTFELMTVEQPATVDGAAAADAVAAQATRAGETAVPLPEVAAGSAMDAPEPAATRPEPGRDEPPAVVAPPPAAPRADTPGEAPERGPDLAGGEAPSNPSPRPLLAGTPSAMAEILSGLTAEVALPRPPAAAPAPARAPDAGTTDVFASRSAEIAALTERINARRASRDGRPRRKAISTNTSEYRYASYMEAWRRKVERIGNLNYPKEARELGLFGSLILHVAVRADGSLEGVRVVRSSGHDVLDQAAVHIVQLAAPYAPFPEGIAAETDVLDITRVWQFQRNHRLGWD